MKLEELATGVTVSLHIHFTVVVTSRHTAYTCTHTHIHTHTHTNAHTQLPTMNRPNVTFFRSELAYSEWGVTSSSTQQQQSVSLVTVMLEFL